MASELRRRDVLRVSGVVALAGTAGCLDGAAEELPEAENETADGDEATPADDGGTETPEGGDDSDETDGRRVGESNESDDVEPPEDTADEGSGGTDRADEAGDSNGTDDSTGDGEGTDSTEGDATETGTEDEEDDGGETEAEASDGNESDGSAEDDGTGEDEEDEEDDETPSDDPPEGFVTYTNEGLGYALVHPEEWKVEESDEEVYVGDPGSGRELGVLTFDAAAFDSSEALAAEFLAGLEADYEDVEVREEGDRTLGSGQDARLLDVGYVNPDDDRGRRRSRMLFAIDPKTDAGYVVEVAASTAAFDDEFAERADTMLGSFRIEAASAIDRVGGIAVASGGSVPASDVVVGRRRP